MTAVNKELRKALEEGKKMGWNMAEISRIYGFSYMAVRQQAMRSGIKFPMGTGGKPPKKLQ